MHFSGPTSTCPCSDLLELQCACAHGAKIRILHLPERLPTQQGIRKARSFRKNSQGEQEGGEAKDEEAKEHPEARQKAAAAAAEGEVPAQRKRW
jgi:hypothetical protein